VGKISNEVLMFTTGLPLARTTVHDTLIIGSELPTRISGKTDENKIEEEVD
jgi:hypothetical protein